MSAHHLAKVLRDLGRAGIVDAVRGVGGGYRFIGNPKRLTLMDIIELFEPARAPERPHTEAGQALARVLGEIDEHAAATFRSITLSTMLKLMRAPVRA
jgi:Rrf2 family protein